MAMSLFDGPLRLKPVALSKPIFHQSLECYDFENFEIMSAVLSRHSYFAFFAIVRCQCHSTAKLEGVFILK